MAKIIEGTRKEKIGQRLNYTFEVKTEHMTEGFSPGYSFNSVVNKLKEFDPKYSFIFPFIEEIFEGKNTIEKVVDEVYNKAVSYKII